MSLSSYIEYLKIAACCVWKAVCLSCCRSLTSTRPEDQKSLEETRGFSAVPATDGLEKEQCTVQRVQLQVVRVCCGGSHLTPLPGGSKDTLQSSEAGRSEHLRTVDKRPTVNLFSFRFSRAIGVVLGARMTGMKQTMKRLTMKRLDMPEIQRVSWIWVNCSHCSKVFR